SHDAVLRMNEAGVEGFETDVGSKTTVRLINSQMLDVKHVADLKKIVNKDCSLFVWRTGPRDGNLTKWHYDGAGEEYFNNFITWVKGHPSLIPHLIHPSTLWGSWDVIHQYTNEHLVEHVPSTGFTGIHLMSQMCQYIDVYGYITPMHTDCHYYKTSKCHPLEWHPINEEKNFLRRLHIGSQEDISTKGKLSLYGSIHNGVNC
ncbi:beta-galactoside alpha-2,6-sialyltransferase 2-like, partial [Saccoglossus kowalevskii]|uniref:beta-galactoside alpha-(2,6)-sialyltransferase n=1 Tax=Saccoglossus kowalevskii TaxID=10224 RepID=A0ABM0M1K6_SACKO